MKSLLLLAALCLSVGCSAPERSIRTLQSHGFTRIHTTGYEFGACGPYAWSSTGFVAKNPRGSRVGGAVCCGLHTGCSLKF